MQRANNESGLTPARTPDSMTLVHHLRGYDKHTELLGVECDIAESLLPLVRGIDNGIAG